jgi:hypothetical protein
VEAIVVVVVAAAASSTQPQSSEPATSERAREGEARNRQFCIFRMGFSANAKAKSFRRGYTLAFGIRLCDFLGGG